MKQGQGSYKTLIEKAMSWDEDMVDGPPPRKKEERISESKTSIERALEAN